MNSEYQAPHPDPPICQFLFRENQSSPLDVSNSTWSPNHLPYMSVLVHRVQVISPRGQYQYPEYLSSHLDVSIKNRESKLSPLEVPLISIEVSTSTHSHIHLLYKSVLVSKVKVICHRRQYFYTEPKSSLLMVSISTQSPRHLCQWSVLVHRVPDISPSGQSQYPESKSSPIIVSTSIQSTIHPSRCQYLYTESKSSPQMVSLSTQSPSHLPGRSVTVSKVPVISPRGQY